MKEIKLNKSQRELFNRWQQEVKDRMQRVLQSMQEMANDLTYVRMEAMAAELGIDLENGNWDFDSKALLFRKVEEEEEKKEPEKKIPSRKNVKKSGTKTSH